MKLYNLMIGDWVYILDKFTGKWELGKVTLDLMQRMENESWNDGDIVKGVPLTKEILRDSCTQHKVDSNEYYFNDTPVVDKGNLGIFIGTFSHNPVDGYCFDSFAELVCVHDLQHALSVAGWENYKIKIKEKED